MSIRKSVLMSAIANRRRSNPARVRLAKNKMRYVSQMSAAPDMYLVP